MTPFRLLLVSVFLIVICISSFYYCDAAHLPLTYDLRLDISVDKSSFVVGETISVICVIKNASMIAVNLPPIMSMDLLLHIRHKDRITAARYGPRALVLGELKMENIVTLRPGESHMLRRTIEPSTYYMPEEVGIYELSAEYSNKLEHMGDVTFWTGKIESDAVSFTVE